MGKWEMVRLGDVADLVNGYAFDSKAFNNESNGMPIIRIRDVVRGYTDTYTTEEYKKEFVVQNGDLLIGMDGEFNIAPWKSDDALLNQRVCKIKSSTSRLLDQYLYYFLPKALKDIEDTTSFVTVKHLSSKKIANIGISLPPLSMQQQIADVLDRASALIEKRKAQIDKLDLLVKSQFVEMFGDPVTNPKGWEKDRLGDIADVGSSKRVFVEELVDEGIPFYRGTEIGAMATGDTILPTLFITQEHYERLRDATGVPQIGDLLMPSICPDGRIWRVNTNSPFYFKDGRVLWVHFTETTFNDTYLLYALKERIIADYSSIASGTTFAELKIFSLKNVCVLMPPAKLQKQFADFVHQAEAQKSLLQQSLAKLEQNYKSLMQKCFQGEV